MNLLDKKIIAREKSTTKVFCLECRDQICSICDKRNLLFIPVYNLFTYIVSSSTYIIRSCVHLRKCLPCIEVCDHHLQKNKTSKPPESSTAKKRSHKLGRKKFHLASTVNT